MRTQTLRMIGWCCLAAALGICQPAGQAAADLIPRALDVGHEHLDTCNPDNSNIYMGPLPGHWSAFLNYGDDYQMFIRPHLYEAELIIMGHAADSAQWFFPLVTTCLSTYWTSGTNNGTDFTYAYAAWTQNDVPETGPYTFEVRNQTPYPVYFSVAVTEAGSARASTVEPLVDLPAWWNLGMIQANALQVPQGGGGGAGRIGQVGWVDTGGGQHAMTFTGPEPATLSLLALGALAMLKRKRKP